jgi:CheY-like chemotaxis protein
LETAALIHTIQNGLDVPILMLSASVFDGLHEKMNAYGVNRFLAKPASPAELLASVFQMLHIETNRQAASQDSALPDEASASDVVSHDLRTQLLNAAHDSDYGTLMELIQILGEKTPSLAAEFTEMANSFSYASIIERLG